MQDKTIGDLINELKALRLREARVISLLEAAATQRDSDTEDHGFERGDRIKIKNKVKKPANWGDEPWDYQQAKLATVTRATLQRIYFVTDNGISSWRAPHNVERL